MVIYLLMVITILLLRLLSKQGMITRKRYCIIIGSMFALVTGLRFGDVGSDTWVYYGNYEQIQAIANLKDAIGVHKDIAYFTFIWILGRLGSPFWVVTLIVGIFFYYSVSRFIYRYSSDCALSYLILMAFNFFQFSMTGIRQTIALGFALLTLYEAFKPDFRYIRIMLFIFIGYLFHNTCAVYLILLPLLYYRKRINGSFLNFSIILLIVGFIFRNQIMLALMTLSADTRFAQYDIENTGTGFSTYIMFFAIYIFLLFRRKRYVLQAHRYSLDIWLLFFAILFQGTVLVQPVMFRIAWYFAISLIVILPKLIETFPGGDRQFISFGTYCGILLMYFGITIGSANVVPYKFFWQ